MISLDFYNTRRDLLRKRNTAPTPEIKMAVGLLLEMIENLDKCETLDQRTVLLQNIERQTQIVARLYATLH